MFVPLALPPDVSSAPLDVLKMIQCGCSSDRPCATTRCSCSAAKLSCSMFCGCRGMTECQNEQTKAMSADDGEYEREYQDTYWLND